MSSILKFKGEMLYSTPFYLLFVWQYVTCVTTFKTVYTLINYLYHTTYGILYHFKKSGKYDQKIPHSHTADQTTAP